MKTQPTECQVLRLLKAGYTHWVSYENNLGEETQPFIVNAGFPTTASAVDYYIENFKNQNVKFIALKELYEAN